MVSNMAADVKFPCLILYGISDDNYMQKKQQTGYVLWWFSVEETHRRQRLSN
jgi:hypothetical protein